MFILRGFIAQLPNELFEAARMDGAGEFKTFLNIVVPLSKPIIGTVAIMNLLYVWNDFVWPLIVLSDDAKKTLPIGLAFFNGAYSTSYGPLMAGYVIACIPLLVLFFFAMKYFIEGLTSGALKA
jgi:ABC-type glycerol-3-phosphate transport system permease component